VHWTGGGRVTRAFLFLVFLPQNLFFCLSINRPLYKYNALGDHIKQVLMPTVLIPKQPKEHNYNLLDKESRPFW
jgi:hypothetical protein